MSGRPLLSVRFAILAIAIGLRLWGVSRWSLDGDEIYSYYDVRRMLAGGEWPFGARTYPLGYLFMTGFAWVLGLGELALRLPSVLCGVGAVAALLWIRADERPPAVSLVAGLLAALSPWLVYHAQTARFYGPLLLFATLATLWVLPGPGRRRWSAVTALLLAMLCHPSAILLAPALVIPTVLRPGGLPRVLIGLFIAAGLGGVVLMLDDGSILEVFRHGAASIDPNTYDAAHLVLGLGYAVGPALGLAATLGLVLLARARSPEAIPLAAASLLPPVVLLAAALAGAATYQRYAMAALPATLLLAGHALAALASRRLLAGIVAMVLLLLTWTPALTAHVLDGNRHDARAVALWLAEHAGADDLLALEEHSNIELYLYDQPGFSDITTFEAPLTTAQRRSFLGNKLDSWLALKLSRLAGEDSRFLEWVNSYYDRVATVGEAPPAWVRHDNRYVIYHRRERMLDK